MADSTMNSEPSIGNLTLTQKETDLIVAAVGMLWNARRFGRVDANGDPHLVYHDVVALLERLKGFRGSAFSRS